VMELHRYGVLSDAVSRSIGASGRRLEY